MACSSSLASESAGWFPNLTWTSSPAARPERPDAAVVGQPVGRVQSPAADAAAWRLQRDGHTLIPSRPFCLEICAGSGRLTAELRRRGLDAWAVGQKGGRLTPETSAWLYVDLTSTSDAPILRKLLAHPQLVYVHFAPPHETASTARDKALPGAPGGGPPPLRSADYPLGFPDLQQRLPREWPRVLAANAIYQAVADCIHVLRQRRVAWSIGNPRGSYLWLIPFVRDLISRSDVAEVQLQHCMLGGARPKWTSFWHSPPGMLAALHRVCDGSHVHASWKRRADGTSATALETVYPVQLCEAIASEVMGHLQLTQRSPLAVVRSRGSAATP